MLETVRANVSVYESGRVKHDHGNAVRLRKTVVCLAAQLCVFSCAIWCEYLHTTLKH